MGLGELSASGIVTNYHLSIPNNIWYTTTEENEVIPLVDEMNGYLRLINDIQIFAKDTSIIYRLCRIDNKVDKNIGYYTDVIFVDSNSIDSTVGVSINAIQILGLAGQSFRFKGSLY